MADCAPQIARSMSGALPIHNRGPPIQGTNKEGTQRGRVACRQWGHFCERDCSARNPSGRDIERGWEVFAGKRTSMAGRNCSPVASSGSTAGGFAAVSGITTGKLRLAHAIRYE